MSEKFSGEKGFTPENSEDQKYKEYKKAAAEVSRIMRDIEHVFSTNPKRSEAERIIVENISPQMDKALEQSKEAYNEWLEGMEKNIGQEKKESN